AATLVSGRAYRERSTPAWSEACFGPRRFRLRGRLFISTVAKLAGPHPACRGGATVRHQTRPASPYPPPPRLPGWSDGSSPDGSGALVTNPGSTPASGVG